MSILSDNDWKSVVWGATLLGSEMVVPLREIKKFDILVKKLIILDRELGGVLYGAHGDNKRKTFNPKA